jgi:hypothetical protein
VIELAIAAIVSGTSIVLGSLWFANQQAKRDHADEHPSTDLVLEELRSQQKHWRSAISVSVLPSERANAANRLSEIDRQVQNHLSKTR